MIVTDIAKTAKNPVLIPNIRKIREAASPELVAWETEDKSIFSGDANLGTLNIAFARNNTNKEIETFFKLFCSRGKRIKIALPKIIPWSKPIANAPKTATSENMGSRKMSDRNGINANTIIICF